MTWAEQRGRAIVYARSGGRCELCTRQAESVHHRVKRSQGGTWEPANLLHLCGDGTRRCHAWIEAHPTFSLELGLWLRAGTDPTTVPAWHKPLMFTRDWWLLDNDGCLTMAEAPVHDTSKAELALTLARLPLPNP